MTRNHDIVSLISNNDEMIDLLYCTEHTKKKLECYCNVCKEPVCTECIIHSHNGYSVKSWPTVHKEFTAFYYRKKEEIERVILPKHKEVLANELQKRSAFTDKVDEMEKKIDAHTHGVVEMVKEIGKQTVLSLREAEKEGLQEKDKFKESNEEQINQLQHMCERISDSLKAQPEQVT